MRPTVVQVLQLELNWDDFILHPGSVLVHGGFLGINAGETPSQLLPCVDLEPRLSGTCSLEKLGVVFKSGSEPGKREVDYFIPLHQEAVTSGYLIEVGRDPEVNVSTERMRKIVAPFAALPFVRGESRSEMGKVWEEARYWLLTDETVFEYTLSSPEYVSERRKARSFRIELRERKILGSIVDEPVEVRKGDVVPRVALHAA